ncbi:hypothetical protein W911_14310 [Hyphomicrobium nitrativorans NL23]|uniref:Uncharacterized protein n=1 Tax=Hyphomicrobium nitrativorans NL23 TaxID=1029756 RepID=V5SK38_9HYPH|nr:hypothetical protein [Hyphomicrobium nitrativorans]AHB50319.1 hypothetical protein W911_14310 [Hyphomicrobium nitrativorans NL23]
MTRDEQIKRAKAIANALRPYIPEKAREIDQLVSDLQGNKRETVEISVGVKYRIEKYEGDYSPEKTPVETVEGEG